MKAGRRAALLLALGVACTRIPAFALSRPGGKRLGVLWPADEGSLGPKLLTATQLHLAELGYVSGRNLELVIRVRAGSSKSIDDLARELAAAGVDAVLTQGTLATRAMANATRTIPIVTSVSDPVASGFALELNRPGGNVTGMAQGGPETLIKRMELVRAFDPRVTSLAVLYDEPLLEFAKQAAIAARAAHLDPALVRTDRGAPARALAGLPRGPVWAADLTLLRLSDELRVAQMEPYREFLRVAIRLRIPTFSADSAHVDEGALASLTPENSSFGARHAAQLDQIFRGVNPALIPFEYPSQFRLRVNRATAAGLKLAIPPEVLIRADKIIG